MKSSYTSTIVGLLIAAAVVGAGIWVGGSADNSANGSREKNTRTQTESGINPDFSLPNYSGETVSLEDVQKPIAVINLWASWCPFCTEELPAFVRLQEEFPQTVKVLAVNRGETKQQAKEFTDQADLTGKLTFLLDPDESYYRRIGGFSMPETLFLNADREVVRHQRGPLTFEQMKSIVKEIATSSKAAKLNAASSSGGCIAGVCGPGQTHES